ncbi:MAG TPA: hypothetical protein VKE69_01405 [Planctomycetota bacterium]|nr:hypothetical protein [Planctomycetota bacterium]
MTSARSYLDRWSAALARARTGAAVGDAIRALGAGAGAAFVASAAAVVAGSPPTSADALVASACAGLAAVALAARPASLSRAARRLDGALGVEAFGAALDDRSTLRELCAREAVAALGERDPRLLARGDLLPAFAAAAVGAAALLALPAVFERGAAPAAPGERGAASASSSDPSSSKGEASPLLASKQERSRAESPQAPPEGVAGETADSTPPAAGAPSLGGGESSTSVAGEDGAGRGGDLAVARPTATTGGAAPGEASSGSEPTARDLAGAASDAHASLAARTWPSRYDEVVRAYFAARP